MEFVLSDFHTSNIIPAPLILVLCHQFIYINPYIFSSFFHNGEISPFVVIRDVRKDPKTIGNRKASQCYKHEIISHLFLW